MNYITANSVRYYVMAKLGGNLQHFHMMKNGAIQATYEVNGKKCSRFISRKSIANVAIKLRAIKAEEVNLVSFGSSGHRVVTDHGTNNYSKYICSYQSCQCYDFFNNNLEQMIGYKVCKHTIASAKRSGVAKTLSQLTAIMERQALTGA